MFITAVLTIKFTLAKAGEARIEEVRPSPIFLTYVPLNRSGSNDSSGEAKRNCIF